MQFWVGMETQFWAVWLVERSSSLSIARWVTEIKSTKFPTVHPGHHDLQLLSLRPYGNLTKHFIQLWRENLLPQKNYPNQLLKTKRNCPAISQAGEIKSNLPRDMVPTRPTKRFSIFQPFLGFPDVFYGCVLHTPWKSSRPLKIVYPEINPC